MLFTASAAILKSNVLKNPLIPSAKNFPTFSHLRFFENAFNPVSPVFIAFAIVLPIVVPRPGTSTSPLISVAKDFPTFFAVFCISDHGMLFSADFIFFPMVFPSSVKSASSHIFLIFSTKSPKLFPTFASSNIFPLPEDEFFSLSLLERLFNLSSPLSCFLLDFAASLPCSSIAEVVCFIAFKYVF